jgi:hypothetical protein
VCYGIDMRILRNLVTGILLAWSAYMPSARADSAPKGNADYLMIGPPLGATFHANNPVGFVAGIEASLVHLDRHFAWYGAYTDLVHDFGSHETRFTVGPELGYACFGIDGGYALGAGEYGVRHGLAVRPMISLVFVMLYGRVEQFFGERAETVGELGLLFKLPVLLREGSYNWREESEPSSR